MLNMIPHLDIEFVMANVFLYLYNYTNSHAKCVVESYLDVEVITNKYNTSAKLPFPPKRFNILITPHRHAFICFTLAQYAYQICFIFTRQIHRVRFLPTTYLQSAVVDGRVVGYGLEM